MKTRMNKLNLKITTKTITAMRPKLYIYLVRITSAANFLTSNVRQFQKANLLILVVRPYRINAMILTNALIRGNNHNNG